MRTPKNHQKVVQVKYIPKHNVIELTYDSYQAIGCLAQVENPNAKVWHETKRYPKFYVLPCPKSLSSSYFSEIFSSKPSGECSILEQQKSYSRLSHRICEDCFKELVAKQSTLECYCVGLEGPPESNFTKLYTRRRQGINSSSKSKVPVQLAKETDPVGSLESHIQETDGQEQVQTEEAEQAETVEFAEKEPGTLTEGDYVKIIADLEDKVKELEEEVDAGHDLISQLTVSHRKVTDEVNDARTTILNSGMLDKYGTAEIGVKILGQINTEGWWEECKDKFGGNPEKFGSWQSRVDELLRKQTFNPIKQVPDGKGGSKNVIDEDNEELAKLRKNYGPLVANAVGVVALEIATWNPSGRYNTSMPWDFRADEKALLHNYRLNRPSCKRCLYASVDIIARDCWVFGKFSSHVIAQTWRVLRFLSSTKSWRMAFTLEFMSYVWTLSYLRGVAMYGPYHTPCVHFAL